MEMNVYLTLSSNIFYIALIMTVSQFARQAQLVRFTVHGAVRQIFSNIPSSGTDE